MLYHWYAWPATGSPSYLTNSSSHLASHQPLIINWFLPSTFEDHLIVKSSTSDDHQNLMTKLWPSLPQLMRLLSDHLGWSSTRTTLRYVKLSTSFSHYFQHNFLRTIIFDTIFWWQLFSTQFSDDNYFDSFSSQVQSETGVAGFKLDLTQKTCWSVIFHHLNCNAMDCLNY